MCLAGGTLGLFTGASLLSIIEVIFWGLRYPTNNALLMNFLPSSETLLISTDWSVQNVQKLVCNVYIQYSD